jgi:hypothetical protein
MFVGSAVANPDPVEYNRIVNIDGASDPDNWSRMPIGKLPDLRRPRNFLMVVSSSVYDTFSGRVMARQQRLSEEERIRAKHRLLCSMVVSTRCVGKAVAMINAMWIIVSTLFEFIGVYSNCWCSGVQFWRGMDGYVTLFVTPVGLENEANAAWIGGTSLAIVACALSVFGFVLGAC